MPEDATPYAATNDSLIGVDVIANAVRVHDGRGIPAGQFAEKIIAALHRVGLRIVEDADA